MKANEAPEKIYVHVRANKELGTTWHNKKITNSDIEYIRADVFNNALDIITNLTDGDPEYLCEIVQEGEPDWCENNCTSDGTIPRVCLLKALKYYQKEE